LSELKAIDYDGLYFPGGFGAAKNLCDFGFSGTDCVVNPDVARVITEFREANKAICFLCISPAVGAKVLGDGVELTIGNDAATASALESMGAKHVEKAVTEYHIDRARRIVSSPAYMYETSVDQVSEGIANTVDAFAELVG